MHAPLKTNETTDLSAEARGLEWALRRKISGEVRFTAGDRALYATDSSNYRQVPIGVVVPRTTGDVLAAVEVCRRFGVPITSRGGGTSLAGQTCNVAVIFDHSKYLHRLLELDPERRRARVQPGLVLDHLNHAADRYHLTFGPAPATHSHCCLGGMIGNNSGGVHSVLAQFLGAGPTTADNVESLDVLTYNGTRLRVGATSEAEAEAIIR